MKEYVIRFTNGRDIVVEAANIDEAWEIALGYYEEVLDVFRR